ncbi:hypothetical protein AAFF_G00389710 [Aldrovandia affinis]|uniref:8-oxo-dGDP phosphatase NUDT18 n=1 Tax=Aldrovandia affinis TaxID=143900 RepID=A0AAD7SEG7_9TELE|nr:hypothetical protein AAFF_G00389710 [Aldrovandia affinis]
MTLRYRRARARTQTQSKSMSSAALILEDKVEKILNGEGLEVKEFDCAPEQVKAVVLRRTVCYIVCAVIINAKNEVLMMQEAKPECYGRWYLPAGRMEEAESIVEAMQREVKEETGLDCQPITLLLVQEQGLQWIRFVFLAEVTGGSMKTEAEADAESLQAGWWDRKSPLPLRGRDILCLIDAGLKYSETPWFPPALPVNMPCALICQRLLLTFSGGSAPDDGHGDDLWVLLGDREVEGEGEEPHLPVVASAESRDITWAGRTLVSECMLPSSCRRLSVTPRGILGVQHGGGRRSPGRMDGVCFNVLASLERTGTGDGTDAGTGDGTGDGGPPTLESSRFRWHKVDSARLRDKIRERMSSGSLLPVQSLS